LDATSPEQFAVQTDSIRFNFSFNNRLGVNAMLKKVSVDALDSTFDQPLQKNRNFNFSKTFPVPPGKPLTQPYWLQNKMEEGYFNVKDQQKIGQPDVDPAYITNITINIEGQDFNFAKAVKYKFTDPVKGEVYWPLTIVPPYTLKLEPEIYIGKLRRDSSNLVTYEKKFTSFKSNNLVVTAKKMSGENGYTIGYGPTVDSFVLNKGQVMSKMANDKKDWDIDPVFNSQTNKIEPVTITEEEDFVHRPTRKELSYLTKITYDHLPAITYFSSSKMKIEFFGFSTVGKKIGYIIGAGDKVPDALEQMGYDVTLLGDKELSRNNLQQFDAIITGVRAYNTDVWLNNYYDKLMKYVNDGGNLIVQYNTSNQVGPVRAKIGPYPFDISRTRVTDENAEIKFTNPSHSVLHYPNEITQEDFKGWIQERSIYHASNFDKTKLETVFSMHDPGENDDEGSLIIGKYGKGTFVYTGLVFFRELPAGVPGAYRLLANLIALNKQKAF